MNVPVEHFLLLLCANALVLEEQVEERALWFFEAGICARLEISEV